MRSTDDLKNFLGEHYNKESENPYWTQVETLQKLKVFGAGLFVKSFTTEKIIDPTLGAHMLLRQFLSELDAIIILLEQGATEQCNIHLRTMLELALQVEYMTENSNNERGLHYNLMFKLRQFGFYGSLVAGSEKRRKLANDISKDRFNYLFSLPEWDQDLRGKMDDLESFLFTEPLKEHYEYYRKLEQRQRPRYWYSFYGGPKNLEQLAHNLGYPAIYNIIYRDLSGLAHGEMAIPGKIKFQGESKKAEVNCLREYDNNDCVNICNYSIIFCQICFHAFIPNIIPEENEKLKSWEFNKNKFPASI